MRLHPYYYYSFVLDLILYDTQQNRALSLMIGNIQLKNGQNKLLANFHKSVPVFKAFPGRSIFSHFYTLVGLNNFLNIFKNNSGRIYYIFRKV